MPSYPQCAAAAPCNDAHREMRPNGFTDYAPARASRLAPSASARGHASRARRHFLNLISSVIGTALAVCPPPISGSVCARPIEHRGRKAESRGACTRAPSGASRRYSRPPQAHSAHLHRSRLRGCSRSCPCSSSKAALGSSRSREREHSRALSVDRMRSALHLRARDATCDADDAPSARTNDHLWHIHAWWCTAMAALAAHKSLVLDAAEAANLQRHAGEAGIL